MILQFGDGKWGKKHTKILKELGKEVVVVDIESNYKNVIDETKCDCVIITTSSVNHFPILLECLIRKIPVFCEKPVCLKRGQLEILRIYNNSNDVIFMSGHQLCFDETVIQAVEHGVWYINSQRTGAVPRDEGAIFSLAVHDIAIAQYVMAAKDFEVTYVSGNMHNAKIILASEQRCVEILVQSFANVRLRHMALIGSDGWCARIEPDNWNRSDLLKKELKYFLDCVYYFKKVPERNNLYKTIIVMETVFKIMEALGYGPETMQAVTENTSKD
jgi:predicted dehydrogenase